ncbi:MAG TPA: hypothetical protein VFM58_06430 [Solirubrobacteraceae bacterium]|nr:hypothetical protein [Solirubrobacteraceae bacterium]
MSEPLTVRYFTDPACPPDPARMRLCWLYGDQIAWDLRMIAARPERGAGWPHERGSDATIHACRAVVGTRLRWPDRTEAMLRRLQLLAAAGELLDDSDTLETAAAQAGLPVTELAAYCAEPEVEAALRADMALAAGRRCGEIAGGDLSRLTRRPDPEAADEVVRWAPVPLTDAEVAAICGR